MPDSWAILVLTIILTLYLELVLFAAALGLDPWRLAARRYLAAVGLSITAGVGTLIGFLLLLAPGLILFMRWILAFPILLAEEADIGECIGRSWNLTKGHWPALVAILGVALLSVAPYFLIYWSGVWFLPAAPESIPPLVSLFVNLAIYAIVAFEWLLIVALYRRLEGGAKDELPAIFS
jgi:hypothetical protein